MTDLLFGHAKPSGKLTASWPRAEGQIPVYFAHKMTGRPPDGEGGYRFKKYHFTEFVDENVTPLFPFGFGLSYTSFAYSDLEVLTSQKWAWTPP